MKKGMTKTLTKTLGAALVIAGAMGLVTATAEAAKGKSGAEMLRSLDKDGDQRLSMAEFEAGYAEHFAEADMNADGSLTKDEVTAKANMKDGTNKGLKADKKMAKKDMNADGAISQDEYASAKSAKFEKMDSNKDGYLTAQEIDSMKMHKRK